MTTGQSRYERMDRRDEPTRSLGRSAARDPHRPRNPYPYGTRQYWLWLEGYNAERQALQRVAIEQQEPRRRRPAPETRRPAGTRTQRLAQVAGTLCSNPAFQAWCGVADPEEAAAWVRRICGIASRRELDTDPAAARIFHARVRRPFAASRDQ